MKSIIKAQFIIKLNTVLVFILPVFLSAIHLPSNQSTVHKFESSEFKVSINFPNIYKEKIDEKITDNNKVQRTLSVTSKVENENYLLNVAKHPIALITLDNLAKASLKAFVKPINGEIKSQEIYKQNNNEGLEALIYWPERKRYIHYRVIFVSPIQYQVIVNAKDSLLSSNAIDYLQSFKILN